jgi:hypothetical protein
VNASYFTVQHPAHLQACTSDAEGGGIYVRDDVPTLAGSVISSWCFLLTSGSPTV